MTIYYAHCQAIYGTPQEDRDVEMLEDLGFDVMNPNVDRIRRRCREVEIQHGRGAVMEEVFKPVVSACDALAFRALPDGRIPAGIAKEISWAKEQSKPILELPTRILGRTISVEETREYLKEIGQR